jgi:hypothetical protein
MPIALGLRAPVMSIDHAWRIGEIGRYSKANRAIDDSVSIR